MKRDIYRDSDLDRFFEEILKFLERDDLSVEYREERMSFTKKDLMPNAVSRIKEVKSPDGLKVVISETEVFPDDCGVSFHEVLYELSNNWFEPRRIVAFMYFGEDGTPIFSEEDLYNRLRTIWGLVI